MSIAGSDRPDVLLITCHDLGRHLGCYGTPTVHSPSFDYLAATGVRMARAFCVAPQCSPSRSAIATGRYPHSNGVMGLTHHPFTWDLGLEEVHLAQLLREQGYETHLCGFQHVTTGEERLGFDHIYGRDLGPGVAQQAEAILRGPRSSRPRYIEVNLEEPHRPYDQGGVQPDNSAGVTIPGYLPDSEAVREEVAALQGAIREADRAVGRILEAVDAAGISDETLVIFTADHGLSLPRAKCTLYDPGIEVAMIARWPGSGIAGGRVVEHLVSNVDLLPSLLEVIGVPVPERVQGRSFFPALLGETFTGRDAIYSEKTYHSYYDPMRAIRTDRFKLIRNFEASFAVEVPGDVQQGAIFLSAVDQYHGSVHPEVELYDLELDPLEQRNLADDLRYADALRELDGGLWSWMRETGDPLLHGPVPSPRFRSSLAAAPTLDAD